jgi:hypothetical protein
VASSLKATIGCRLHIIYDYNSYMSQLDINEEDELKDYNSQRTRLILPEYGRHIQKMVDYVSAIEDTEERNRMARILIAVMGNLNPHLRDINDFKHKLWDHLHVISDFKIDIESPYPKPSRESICEPPRRIDYPAHPIRIKHYGRVIEQMVKDVAEMEEGPIKTFYITSVANQMKKAYLTWNKDSVSDETIIRDLGVLSDGKIRLSLSTKLMDTREFKPSGAGSTAANSGKRRHKGGRKK